MFAHNAFRIAFPKISSYSVPSGFSAHIRPEGPSLRMGWDGRNIKNALQCSSYFVGIPIEHVNIYLYVYSKIAANIIMGFKI